MFKSNDEPPHKVQKTREDSTLGDELNTARDLVASDSGNSFIVSRYSDFVKGLLERDLSVQQIDSENCRSLRKSSTKGYLEIVRFLIQGKYLIMLCSRES